MRSFLAALCLSSIIAMPAMAADHYDFDKEHTNILFFVNHLGFSEMVGRFTQFDGNFTFDKDKPETSTLDIKLLPAGIKTSSAKLDEHLQTDQFFNTAKYPDIHFVSKSVKATGAQDGEVLGDLTMLGVTKPVTLKVHFNKADVHPLSKSYVAGFSGEATIKRSDFGMTQYVPMVGDDVRLVVNTEGVNADYAAREKVKK